LPPDRSRHFSTAAPHRPDSGFKTRGFRTGGRGLEAGAKTLNHPVNQLIQIVKTLNQDVHRVIHRGSPRIANIVANQKLAESD
jgi:hypothetical protein